MNLPKLLADMPLPLVAPFTVLTANATERIAAENALQQLGISFHITIRRGKKHKRQFEICAIPDTLRD